MRHKALNNRTINVKLTSFLFSILKFFLYYINSIFSIILLYKLDLAPRVTWRMTLYDDMLY